MKRRVKNHLGFSLVEMITAFAILGVASLGVGGFFVSSSRSYSTSSSETGVQYETQMALNQIENKLIDATLGVNYNLVEPGAEGGADKYNFTMSDTLENDALKEKVLYIFDYKESGFEALLVKWDIENKELLYKEVDLSTYQNQEVKDIPLDGNWDLLAENVENFSVDLSKYLETKTVDVKLGLKKMSQKFETVGTITLRNNVFVNEPRISEIFANKSGLSMTEIDGVILSANTNVTRPGGTVQLSTRVTGTYPSQDIHGWLIAHSYTESDDATKKDILDSNALVDSDTARIDNKVLTVGDTDEIEDLNLNALYVQAMVRNGKDEKGKDKFEYSNIVTIYIRNIVGIDIWPTANMGIIDNQSTLDTSKAEVVDDIAMWEKSTSTKTASTLEIYPLNKIDMDYEIDGDFNTSDIIDVKWSVYDKEPGVIVNINEKTGYLTVDKNSAPGTFIVKAQIGDIENSYPFEVKSQYDKDDDVDVVVLSNMNRGQEPYQCGVKFNGVVADVSDYNWSTVVKTTAGQTVSGDVVEISDTGVLTIKETLPFDYAYNVFVHAHLKSNPEVYGSSSVYVPKVSMYITRSANAQFTPTIGGTIPAGNLICNVVGLENYDIDWTLAKQTNPDFYFTAYGNTNITGVEMKQGDDVVQTAKIVIGADEPSKLQFIRVKAALAGNSGYATTTTLYINTQYGTESGGGTVGGGDNVGGGDDVGGDDATETIAKGYFIDNEETILVRNAYNQGNSVKLTGKKTRYIYGIPYGSENAYLSKWEIVGVTADGNEIDYNPSHIKIERSGSDGSSVRVTIDNEFALLNCGKDIKIKIAFYNSDNEKFEREAEITVSGVTITIKGDNGNSEIKMTRNQRKDVSCSLNNISVTNNIESNLKWTITDKANNIANSVGLNGTDTGMSVEVQTSVKRGTDLSNNNTFKLNVALKINNQTCISDDITGRVTYY